VSEVLAKSHMLSRILCGDELGDSDKVIVNLKVLEHLQVGVG